MKNNEFLNSFFTFLKHILALPESEGEQKLDRLREVFLLLAIREDHLANWQTLKFITCHLFR